MQPAIYVINLEGISDPKLISDYFFARAYGSSCFVRNLQLLRRSFPSVSVAMIGADNLTSETREKLRLLAEQQEFSLVASEPQGILSGNRQPLTMVYQSGLALLKRLTTADTSDVGAAAEGDGHNVPAKDLLRTISMVCEDRGVQVLLCQAFFGRRTDEVPLVLYRGQEATNVASMTPDLTTAMKRHLELRASQRSMDGPVSRLIVRHLCHLVSKPLAAAGIHPNYVTLAGALFALFAVLLFLDGRQLPLAIGGVCWLIGGILDEADGEVARLQGKESTFGSWLDLTLDRVFDAAMLLSLSWPLTVSDRYGQEYLIMTLCALVAVSASSYTGLLYDSWMRSKDRHAYFRLGRDVRILIITLSALFGFRILPIVLCGVFAATEICRRFWVCWRVERSVRIRYD